jgi:hypothetical protein
MATDDLVRDDPWARRSSVRSALKPDDLSEDALGSKPNRVLPSDDGSGGLCRPNTTQCTAAMRKKPAALHRLGERVKSTLCCP